MLLVWFYLHSAKLENLLNVTVALTKPGKASAVFQQQVLRACGHDAKNGDWVLLCQGIITVVCVKAHSFRPTAIAHEVVCALQTLQTPLL